MREMGSNFFQASTECSNFIWTGCKNGKCEIQNHEAVCVCNEGKKKILNPKIKKSFQTSFYHSIDIVVILNLALIEGFSPAYS